MNISTPEKLLATPFFFHFAVPCLYCKSTWSAAGVQLDEQYRLPDLSALDDVPEAPRVEWSDFRMAWNEAGLIVNVRVEGKRQPPWCRASRVEDSDGLGVWISMRDVTGIHRANRFCHQFRFLPAGDGQKLAQPTAVQMMIERARENAGQAATDALAVRAEKRVDGYLLEAFISAAALTGFDAAEHPRLGFAYAVLDREMGEKTLTVGGEFPYQSDPSLWSTLELVR